MRKQRQYNMAQWKIDRCFDKEEIRLLMCYSDKAIMRADYFDTWWDSPVPAFDNATPRGMVARGLKHRLYEVHAHIYYGTAF